MLANGGGGARWLRAVACVGTMVMASGCTTTSVLLSAAGVATDTSVTWEIVKHVHAKLTEDDDVPCLRLDSVKRAVNARCAPFVPGSIRTKDIQGAGLQGCVLDIAVRDPRLWAAVPELIEKGARPTTCAQAPLLALAQAFDCPEFSQASPAVLRAFDRMANDDPRSIHHDVVRMLSCPGAVAAGLDRPLSAWLARGDLDVGKVSFGPLGALHPSYLAMPFAGQLEALGHTARAGLGGYDGVQPRGFEVALRQCDWAALEWWLARVPELANRVPAVQGDQLAWLPLARVMSPKYLAYPASQPDMVRFLIARGADPWQKLPYDAGTSVVEYARRLRSPMLALLEPPMPSTTLAAAPGPGPAR